jgi:hypothetical protein
MTIKNSPSAASFFKPYRIKSTMDRSIQGTWSGEAVGEQPRVAGADDGFGRRGDPQPQPGRFLFAG